MRQKRILAAFITVFLTSAGFTAVSLPHAFGDERDDAVRQREEAAAKREEALSSLEGIDTQLANIYIELQSVRDALPEARSSLVTAQEKLGAAQREKEQVEERLEVAQADKQKLDEEKEADQKEQDESTKIISNLAGRLYRGELTTSPLAVAITSESSEDFIAKISTADTIARVEDQALDKVKRSLAINENQAERQDAITTRIEELQAEVAAAVAAHEVARTAAENKVNELADLEKKDVDLAQSLEDKKPELQSQAAAAAADHQSAKDAIAAIDEANRQQNWSPPPSPGNNNGSGNNGGGSGDSGGIFRMPIDGPITVNSNFGWRFHPVLKQNILHSGVDLRSPCGQTQRATRSGVVTHAGPWGGGGNTVTINHGMVNGSSWVTQHQHLSAVLVYAGQSVDRGDSIGLPGTTGWSTGCHVHYETWRDGTPLNPRSVLGF